MLWVALLVVCLGSWALAVRQTSKSKKAAHTFTIYGYVPGEYVQKDKNTYVKAAVKIEDGVIESNPVATDTPPEGALKLFNTKRNDYDVIYPGLFNLHNHTKQNVLGVWKQAKGQFQNRFEWRAVNEYKLAVSGNMNPWITLGKAVNCASFRYSELQAMALGTTYLQGPSSCVKDFAINRVEDGDPKSGEGSFPNYRHLPPVQAPTDLIYPNEMTFLWNHILPVMKSNAGTQDLNVLFDRLQEQGPKSFSYEAALQSIIVKNCRRLVDKFPILKSSDSAQAVLGTEALKVLSTKANLVEGCSILPDKMLRYVYFIHPPIAQKIQNLKEPYSGIIVHLAEGRQLDPYNQLEFKMLRLLGLDKEHVNLIHAVGVDGPGFKHMADKGMGLVWSPFSNHLLYGETADIETAIKASNCKLLVALGSDWTPTGSRGTLEEAKMARQYLANKGKTDIFCDTNGQKISMDEALYRMMTSNPAEMVGHKGEAGVIADNAAASLIVVSKVDENPYTNLVYKTNESGINLVIVDGKPVYGNITYVEKTARMGLTPMPQDYGLEDYEDLMVYFPAVNKMDPTSIKVNEDLMKRILLGSKDLDDDQDDSETADRKEVDDEKHSDQPAVVKATPEEKKQYLVQIAKALEHTKREEFTKPEVLEGTRCKFDERKVFVPAKSLDKNGLADFKKETDGMDLDTIRDIVALLQGGLMTHSRNKWAPPNSPARKAAATQFSPIYTCQDKDYLDRIGGNGTDPTKETDPTKLFENYVWVELKTNFENQTQNRKEVGNSVPENLAKAYGVK